MRKILSAFVKDILERKPRVFYVFGRFDSPRLNLIVQGMLALPYEGICKKLILLAIGFLFFDLSVCAQAPYRERTFKPLTP